MLKEKLRNRDNLRGERIKGVLRDRKSTWNLSYRKLNSPMQIEDERKIEKGTVVRTRF